MTTFSELRARLAAKTPAPPPRRRGKAIRDDSTTREWAEHLRYYGMHHMPNVPISQRQAVQRLLRDPRFIRSRA